MVEAAALGVVVEAVGAAADHHLALVGLAHVAMHGVGHHHHIHAGLDRFRDKGLQGDGLDRQAEPGHFRQLAGVARDHHAQLAAANEALGGVYARDLPGFGADAGHFAVLDDVHAHGGAGAGIAPGNGIMPPGAAARLPERAEDGVARAVDIQDRAQFLDPLGGDEFGGHALQRVGVGGAQVAPHLMMRLGQHHHATGGEHDVVVQVLAERFIQAAGFFIDRGGGILQVVGADDRGVAPGVAAAKPAFFNDRDIGDAEILAKVVSGGKAVAPCPDDHHIIAGLRFGRGPGAFPAHVVAQCLTRDGKDRIALHLGLLIWWAGLRVRLGTVEGYIRTCKRHNREICDIVALRRGTACAADCPFFVRALAVTSGRSAGIGIGRRHGGLGLLGGGGGTGRGGGRDPDLGLAAWPGAGACGDAGFAGLQGSVGRGGA